MTEKRLDTSSETWKMMIAQRHGPRVARDKELGMNLDAWVSVVLTEFLNSLSRYRSREPSHRGFSLCRTPNDMKCCSAARENRAAPTSQRESALIQGLTMNRLSTYEAKRPSPPSLRGPGNRMNRSKGREAWASGDGWTYPDA